MQVNSLLYLMGRDAEPIYGSFVYPAATEAMPHPEYEFNLVMQKFDEHFVPKRNSIIAQGGATINHSRDKDRNTARTN